MAGVDPVRISVTDPSDDIVDGEGKVLYTHSNPDYTKRLDGATILEELNKVR